MTDLPKRTMETTVKVKWAIGDGSHRPVDAKTFRLGLFHVYKEMEAIGVDLGMDDCFTVSGEDGEIILTVEVRPNEEIHDSEFTSLRPLGKGKNNQ